MKGNLHRKFLPICSPLKTDIGKMCLRARNEMRLLGSVHTVRFAIAICFCLQWAAQDLVMLSQSHSANTSIESCATH